jgi:hypothetical protein
LSEKSIIAKGAFLPCITIIQCPTFNLRIAFTLSNYTLKQHEIFIILSPHTVNGIGPTRSQRPKARKT